MKKAFNYFIAMAFALIPVIIYREYFDPNKYQILQTLYVTVAYWGVVPFVMKKVKERHPTSDNGWYEGYNAFAGYLIVLAIWLIILAING